MSWNVLTLKYSIEFEFIKMFIIIRVIKDNILGIFVLTLLPTKIVQSKKSWRGFLILLSSAIIISNDL